MNFCEKSIINLLGGSVRFLKAICLIGISIPVAALCGLETSAEDAKKTAEASKVMTKLGEMGSNAQMALANTATADGLKIGAPIATEVNNAAKTLTSTTASCSTAIKATNMACLESLSPEVATFLSQHGSFLQAAGTNIQSITQSCSDISQILNASNAAIGALQTACASAQAVCKSVCSKAVASSKTYMTGASKIGGALSQGALVPGTTEAHQRNLANADVPSLAVSLCESYNISGQQAAAALTLGAVAAIKASKCNEETASMDCNNTKNINYGSQACQCARGELAGSVCQGIAISTQSTNGKGISANATSKTSSSDSGSSGTKLGGNSDASEVSNAKSAQGGAGAPESGGGGPGGGGGSGSPYSQDGNSTGRRLNANVLGGFGGGGGGGGSGSAGPGYGETDPKLAAYGPGGAKDPNRSLASEIAKQVTGEGGRTNWEKVRSRYLDNQRTLLNK